MRNDVKNFWKNKVDTIFWYRKPQSIISKKNKKKFFYQDGYTNIAYNCLRKNILKNNGKRIAINFIDKNNNFITINYEQLENLVDAFIVLLFKNFSKKIIFKNTIAIHSSANLVSAVSMLACAKLGITHCVIFDELEKDAIKIRLKLIKCKILITSTDEDSFKNKISSIIKELNIKILRISSSKKKSINNNNLEEFLENNKNSFHHIKYKKIKSNFPAFILFTSGSTGQPKGIVHSTAGYLLYAKYTCERQFGLNKKKNILTASDAGWINGHTYSLYGPLSIGASTTIIEKPMLLANLDHLKNVIIKCKVNIIYLPVTLIRIIKSMYKTKKLKTKSVILLGSMGEPLSKHIANWYSNFFTKKKLQIINTYFQTETGGIICSPTYKDKIVDVPFGTVGRPTTKHLNIFIENKENKSEVKIKNAWPGCMIDVINGKKYWDKYWDKFDNFNLFDFASYDKKKNLIIHGRSDDVINIRGHRIGSEEIESVLLKDKNIFEVCAIGVGDIIEGSKLIVFVTGNKKIDLRLVVKKLMVSHFGTFAIPKDIVTIPELPKTRSGKIMRRTLRELYSNPSQSDLGDISTILKPSIINIIKKKLILNEKNR